MQDRPKASAASAHRPVGHSLVIVDDDENWRFLVAHLLKRTGRFDVIGEAADGRAAIEVAARLQPDILLLDLRMPVMSGEEALPEIRRAAPQTRIVILSGLDAETMAPRMLASGAAAYIEKGGPPGSLESELLRLVEVWS